MKSKRGLLLLGIATAVVFLVACQGEPAPTPTSISNSEAAQPVPAEPTPTPTIPPTPGAASPADSPGTFPLPLTPPPPTLPPTATPPARQTVSAPTPTQSPQTKTPASTPLPDSHAGPTAHNNVEAIRRIVDEYWKALNDYDVDHAIPRLEPGYRTAEEELIRKDIGRMKLFRVKLEVSEETPPTLNEDGDYETYLSVETPIDSRRVLMVFRRIDGAWWIVFSDEVE